MSLCKHFGIGLHKLLGVNVTIGNIASHWYYYCLVYPFFLSHLKLFGRFRHPAQDARLITALYGLEVLQI